jgi:gp16 family phage-associated protein
MYSVEHKPTDAQPSAPTLDCAAPNAARTSFKLRSPQEAQRWFADRGLTISEWALERNFNPALVYQVLTGSRKAVRGRSFQIAVALGIKSRPVDDVLEPA